MNESQTPPKNIVLIGFMGSGKSTVGRELHHRLGYPLVDMDHVIEQRAGKPIAAIFADEGEEAFRGMESELLEELNDPAAPRRIISTGGGVIGRDRNRERPLLHTDDPVARIESLLAVREPLYRETAHLKVDTAGLNCGELATGIL